MATQPPLPFRHEAMAEIDGALLAGWPLPQLGEESDKEERGRVLVVAHQVTVNCMRYLLERLDEAEILAIDKVADVPNCGVTAYEFDPAAGRHGKLVRTMENFVSPLREAGAPVTAEPDVPAAAKA